MTNEYGFFSSKDHDRAYSAEDFCSFFRDFFTDGVLGGNAGELKVSADGGMSVKVSPGTAYIDGRFYRPAETKHFEIHESDGTYPRKDIVVIRCDYSERKVLVDVVEGIASAAPRAPEPVRSGMVYELCIAEIYVAADALEITDADITDTRFDTSLCGIVTGAIDTIDTTDLFRQYQQAWELLMAGAALDEPAVIELFKGLVTVKSVNGISPDEDGNMSLTVDDIPDSESRFVPGFMIRCGSVTSSLNNVYDLDVIFSEPFKEIPVIVAAPVSDVNLTYPVIIRNVSNAGFTMHLTNGSLRTLNWVAMGV